MSKSGKRLINAAKEALDWYADNKEEVDRLIEQSKAAGASGPFFVHMDGPRIWVTDRELDAPRSG